ncbi:non-ribosomal peptide synthetase [Pseudomonas sp. RIT-To-2]|uniref:non-ribosomal peptide synthetase n=1 Tax=Pseudomonas sp. RIT-To-2 TaxID=3462541 RepID=UPI002412F365
MNAADALKLARRFIELPLEKRRLFLSGLQAEGVDFSLFPIPAGVDVQGRDGLSSAQQRMWFLWQMDPLSPAYNLPLAVRLQGALDVDALQSAFDQLAARHETLRTVFVADGEHVRQLVLASVRVEIVRRDLSPLAAKAREQVAHEVADAEARAPFDLVRGPLMRVQLLKLADDEHMLLLTLHHIAADGWSFNVLIEEFVRLYDAACAGTDAGLLPLPVQYRDYALWQGSWLGAGEQDRQLQYWRGKLGDDHAPLQLPLDYPRPSTASYQGARHEWQVPQALADELRQLARAHGVTLFVVLLAAFKVLLLRYTGQRALRVGVPVANRHRAEVEGLIGCFINTQVLHTDIDPLIDVPQLLQRVKETALGAQAHQDMPFERLVEVLAPGRGAGHSPLFQVLFNHQPVVADAGQIRTASGLVVQKAGLARHSARFDLALDTYESAGTLHAAFTYAQDLLDATTIVEMSQHWLQVLAGLTGHSGALIGELPLSGNPALAQAPERASPPASPCIHHLIEQAAAQHPERIAAVGAGGAMTYAALDQQADELAQVLLDAGVQVDERVGVIADRSVQMLVAILAILKAGAAYLPLDPEQPRSRIEFMLADSQVRVLAGAVEGLEGIRQIAVGTPWRGAERRQLPTVSADNLAYVIYTSGTTGQPKGVAVSHGALGSYVYGISQRLPLAEVQSLAMVTTPAADLGHTAFYLALCTGKTLHMLDKATVLDAEAFAAYLAGNAVDLLKIVPSHLQAMLDAGPAALPRRCLVLGGEACSPGLLGRINTLSPALTVINHYGPTETTVGVLTHEVHGQPLLGRPLARVHARVLDDALQPVPGSARGELYIGGPSLARGYLGQPGLTAERFVPDAEGEGARHYRTGDWVSHTRHGELVFGGRRDGQVKIRGHRIEIAEVERCLLAVPGVASAVVRVAGEGDTQQLAAYLVPASGQETATPWLESVREVLKQRLAEPFVPSHLILLERLPVTVNGKLDLKALPEPTAVMATYVAPATPLQVHLASIWAQVLQVEQVGLKDDFFSLGGHSLLATQVVSRVRQQLGVDVALRTLFDTADLQAFADAVARCGQSGALAIEPVNRQEPLPLSHAQHRQWLFWKLHPLSTAYNTPLVVSLEGGLRVEALQAALDALVARHETLRTVFQETEGGVWQHILPQAPVPLGYLDLSDQPRSAVDQQVAQAAFAVFDLATGPLLRARLFKTGEDRHVLAVTLHHIVSDGWSMSIMVREFAAAYNACATGQPHERQPLAIQYADYAAWQRKALEQGLWQEQLAYWKAQLEDDFDLLELPGDRLRPQVQSYRGGRVDIRLPDTLVARLRALALDANATLFHVFLSAFALLLSRYSGREKLNIGVPVTHRDRLELEGLIGFFVNTVVARVGVDHRAPFADLLAHVKETTLQAQANKDVPFDLLVETLRPERGLGYNPLFQVAYNHLRDFGEHVSAHSLHGLRVAEVEVVEQTAQFDLMLNTLERSDGVTATFNFAADLFDSPRIERMARHWCNVLEAVAGQPREALAQVPLLDRAEHRLIIEDWGRAAPGVKTGHCLHERFEAQVRRTPEAEALITGEQAYTYDALNRRANRLAHQLRALGVGPDVLVAIALERDATLVVAMLAVLKAGGGYVPLDPQYPRERLAYMLQDSCAPVLLSHSSLAPQLPASEAVRTLLLDRTALEDFPDHDPLPWATPANLAYSIYTSGSTGHPKGVLIEHGNVSALIDWALAVYPPHQLQGVLAATSVCFDLSVWELFVTLAAGGRVILASNALELPYLPARDSVELINTVPSAIKALLEAGHIPASIHTINLAGEPLKQSLVDALYRLGHVKQVYDLYGPSEDTTYSTWTLRTAGGQANIGRPVAGTSAYLLDVAGQPAHVGGAGELCLAGDGLARGYLGRPGLTAEKFLPDPFDDSGRGGRLYRTGDLARYRADGLIEYAGRIDHQVKVRGLRIELGEIEARLHAHPAVHETVVIDTEGAGGRQLVGYVVPVDTAVLRGSEDQQRLGAALKEHLKLTLPDYMVPAWLVMLERLPLTPNGKLDRKALPPPDIALVQAGYAAPQTDRQRQVAGIWAELLNLEQVGLNDHFFELGGHSLLAAQAVSRINAQLGIDIPLRLIFESPLLSEFTMTLEDQGLSLDNDGLSDIEKLMNDLAEV